MNLGAIFDLRNSNEKELVLCLKWNLDNKNYAEFYKAVDDICYDYYYKAEELNVK